MSHFFAFLSRMKYIDRWGLMNNTRKENISEHSLEVAVIAHALAVLRNTRFGGHVNAERAALLAVFHDVSEILTGDLPTPVKYYNPEIRTAYQTVETAAGKKLLSMLPEDMVPYYKTLLTEDSSQEQELKELVKAADKISALIKCVEELRMGNREFVQAEKTVRKSVEEMHLPEADCFLQEFLPSYSLTLDELE